MHLKYRADRINNSRVYIFFGPNIGVDMASEKDVEDETIFKLNRSNFALEIGAGCDFYFEYFKFAPQIKYSYGLKTLLLRMEPYIPVHLKVFTQEVFKYH